MNRMTIRLWFVAVLMILGCVSTSWIRYGYTFDVRPLNRALVSLPIELEGYLGTDIPLDERIQEILNADSILNRMYERPTGEPVVLHVSAWLRPDSISNVAPHAPKRCYTNAGWKLLEERRVEVTTPKRQLPLNVFLVEREGERCVVAYWYRMGPSIFGSASEARQIHRELWGQRTWPPTIKVLLQTRGDSIDSALPRIEHFASSVFQYTGDL